MWKYLTRKNPWYTATLLVFQLAIGIWSLYKGNLVWGGFFMWCAGVNTAFLMNPELAPDRM